MERLILTIFMLKKPGKFSKSRCLEPFLVKHDYGWLKLVKTALIFKGVTRKKLFLEGHLIISHWVVLRNNCGSPAAKFLDFWGLTGFLRWLFDMQFVSFFLVFSFKRKFLTGSKSSKYKLEKFTKFRHLEPFLAKYNRNLLMLVKTAMIFKGVSRRKLFPKGNT